MPALNRLGEDSHPPFRTRRVFSENGQWYFDTREGNQVGPYHDLKGVKKALAVFLAQKLLITDKSRYSDDNFVPGMDDGIENMVEEIFEYFHQFKLNGQTNAMLWANQRIRELLRDKESTPSQAERMEALRYALDLDDHAQKDSA